MRAGIAHSQSVIAGLDPAIHLLRKNLSKRMDARVKPAHDESALLRRSGKFCRGGINCRARNAPAQPKTVVLRGISAWHGVC
jgi:hypothetical protein